MLYWILIKYILNFIIWNLNIITACTISNSHGYTNIAIWAIRSPLSPVINLHLIAFALKVDLDWLNHFYSTLFSQDIKPFFHFTAFQFQNSCLVSEWQNWFKFHNLNVIYLYRIFVFDVRLVLRFDTIIIFVSNINLYLFLW